MGTIEAGQVCRVAGWSKLVGECGFGLHRSAPLSSHPSMEYGDTVLVLGGWRTAIDGYRVHREPIDTGDIQFVHVLHSRLGTGWVATCYLEPMQ